MISIFIFYWKNKEDKNNFSYRRTSECRIDERLPFLRLPTLPFINIHIGIALLQGKNSDQNRDQNRDGKPKKDVATGDKPRKQSVDKTK